MVFNKKGQDVGDDYHEKKGRAPLAPSSRGRNRSVAKPHSNQQRDSSSSRMRSNSTARSRSIPRSGSSIRSRSVARSGSVIRSRSVARSGSTIRSRSVSHNGRSRSRSVIRKRDDDTVNPGTAIVTGDERSNKFVQFKKFGTDTANIMRVITINEMPAIRNPSDVIVKVKASTVSLKDCYIRRGIWSGQISLPNITGFDVVGSIVKMGSKVEEKREFEIGDAVAACCRTGGNARYIVIASCNLTRIPGNIDSAQAVSLVTTYMTAYQALHRVKPRRRKETLEGINILVTGGNGPTGQAIIELGFRAGASKIFVTADKQYHSSLYDQGVCPLPLDARKWLPLVKGKIDVVIDGICEDGYASPRAALNNHGHLIIIGMTLVMNASERGFFGSPIDAKMQSISTKFMTQTSTYDAYDSSISKPKEWKHDLGYLMALLAAGKISPKILFRIPLEDVAEYHETLETGSIDGIIVCKPWK